MKYECDIVQDLIPLYVDEICSEKSKEMVEEHLQECEKCSDVLCKLKNTDFTQNLKIETEHVLETHAKKERRLSTTVGIVTAGILTIPVIVCLICNLAIGHGLDWFYIVLTSLMIFASLTVVPLMVQENKFLWSFWTFIGSLTALLGVVCLYTKGRWFWVAVVPSDCGLLIFFLPVIMAKIKFKESIAKHKGLLTMLFETISIYAIIFSVGMYVRIPEYWGVSLTITTYALLLPWFIVLVCKFLPIQTMFKGSIISIGSGIYGAFMNDVIAWALGIYTGSYLTKADFMVWNDETSKGNSGWIMLLAGIALAMIFFIIGLIRKKSKK